MKRGTTDIVKVYRGTTQIKKIYRGTTLVWSDWVLKTGHLFDMTSNSAPSPFVVTESNNGTDNNQGSPWNIFDVNQSTIRQVRMNSTTENCTTTLTFNLANPVKVSKIYVSLYRQGVCNNYAQYQDENNNWVTFYSLGANGTGSSTVTLPTPLIVKALRWHTSQWHSEYVLSGAYEIDVIECYEKG